MRRLKRLADGKVFDCTIYLNENEGLNVVYWEDCTWKTEPINSFVPAEANIDY